METATGQSDTSTKPEVAAALDGLIRRPGAVVVRRGDEPVVAHYGSAAAEVAVCTREVGLAIRSDLHTVKLVGDEIWLEGLLERALGSSIPAAGRAASLAGTWCARLSPQSAVVVGPPSAVARWRRATRDAVLASDRVAALGEPTAHLPLCLLGPRLPELLALAGLPDDIAVGGVRTCDLAGDPAIVLREDARRVLLLLGLDRAAEGCDALCEIGRGVGLSLVGADALARLAAAGAARRGSATERTRP